MPAEVRAATWDARVLVTGAASGIGAAVVERAEELGARVGVVDLVPTTRSGAVSAVADVSDPEQAEQAVRDVAERLGGLDVLVNNAGVSPAGRLEETTTEQWRRTLSVNLDGVFAMTRAALPHLRRSNRQPSVVNLGSIAGRSHSRTGSVAYATTKGGVIAFTRQLAWELAQDAIRVNCVCPGLVDTELMRQNVSEEKLRELVSGIPVRRLARPEEIAAVVCFLASPEASYMTGSIVDVNGGLA